ncbi:MAG: hypothetical protein HC767_10095 [Akkermansiaceae bacterium]|nr:hypothetical protein [Akkermansiaceae bacterium]
MAILVSEKLGAAEGACEEMAGFKFERRHFPIVYYIWTKLLAGKNEILLRISNNWHRH